MKNDNITWAKAEIAAKERQIAEKIAETKVLQDVISDLQAYIRIESAKSGPTNTPSSTATPDTDTEDLAALVDSSTRGAKKRAILTALLRSTAPMPTGAVVTVLPSYGIPNATVENTSPQLSNYKADGLVTLEDGGWQITQRGRDYLAEKNKGPDDDA